jgi:thioredoxin 1
MQPITTAEELEKVIADNKVVVIDLFATWCKPCQEMLPVVSELAEILPAPFYKVDIDIVPEAKQITGAKAVPMVIVYKDGRKKEFAFGIVEKEKLKTKIQRVINTLVS